MQPRQILNATRRFLSVYSVMEHKPKIANFSHLIYSEVLSMHSIPIHLFTMALGVVWKIPKLIFHRRLQKPNPLFCFFDAKAYSRKWTMQQDFPVPVWYLPCTVFMRLLLWNGRERVLVCQNHRFMHHLQVQQTVNSKAIIAVRLVK